MRRELEDLPFQAITRRLLPDTVINGETWARDTKPKDFMRSTHVPMNRRMTKPPNMVLISGIPLCFAYGA